MTKSAPKSRRRPNRARPHKQATAAEKKHKKGFKKAFLIFAIVTLLAAIPFCIGKYIEFNTPGPYDSGAYVYSAAHILNGAQIGVEESPSARLGTLFVNMVGVALCGFNETGPEIIQMLLQAAALILTFIAMRKLFGTLAAAVGVIIASIYLSSPLIAKFGNVKEQYMIAFMMLGVSCFVLYQLGGRWWLAFLSGAFLSWAPLFKPTGTTAIGAVGLFVILQPFFKNRTFKQTGVDILLLFAGASAAIGPLYLWILIWDVKIGLPYAFAWKTIGKLLPSATEVGKAKAGKGYVARGYKLVPFSKQWPRVLRYYWLLRLPIVLALGSIILRLIMGVWRIIKNSAKAPYDRFVLLLAVWWLLDMAFVWISPRSYEQYYLPLNASAAVLGGYVIALYRDKVTRTAHKEVWITAGLVGLLLMLIMSWHIFFGIGKSPHSGHKYSQKQKGYVQKLHNAYLVQKNHWKGPWQLVGEYIRLDSEPTDRLYVWGWFPGIYVSAQRFAPTPRACMMPRPAPQALARRVESLLEDFRKEPPRFIVDSRKRHIPIDRPAYELWPIVPKGFMGAKKAHFLASQDEAQTYDELYSQWLREQFGEDEALRYKALKPFRELVTKKYRIVRMFGQHVLFELKRKESPELP